MDRLDRPAVFRLQCQGDGCPCGARARVAVSAIDDVLLLVWVGVAGAVIAYYHDVVGGAVQWVLDAILAIIPCGCWSPVLSRQLRSRLRLSTIRSALWAPRTIMGLHTIHPPFQNLTSLIASGCAHIVAGVLQAGPRPGADRWSTDTRSVGAAASFWSPVSNTADNRSAKAT